MSAKKRKGQTSFETLGVTLAVIVLATFILGNYFDLKDSTEAISIIKIEAVNQLGKTASDYYIKRIDFTEGPGNFINFDIVTEPASMNPTDLNVFNFAAAAKRIRDSTKYVTVNVRVNGAGVPTA